MFKQIQNRLLVSYLVVLSLVLGGFAIAVRIVFASSLNEQGIDKLTALAEGAALSIEIDNGFLRIETDDSTQNLTGQRQALQWFDRRGQELTRKGSSIMTLPFSFQQMVQVQKGTPPIQGVTLPVFDDDGGQRQLVGYVRASQSLEEVQDTLYRLDLGLGGGVGVALILSGLGGVWLTRQAMQPIEQSFQRLQQFTADASHELRSPLMVVKGNAAVALKYGEGMRAADEEKFEAIASATQQMTRLTEDLLLLARGDRLLNTQWQSLNISDLLEDLLQRYYSQAEVKSIHLVGKISSSLWVRGDEAQLSRLVRNLIDNAFHYTVAPGTITVQAHQRGSQVEIRVEDTGVGIAPDCLERVFDRFWRADLSRTYWGGGSGLGLAIAQSIAQIHGGKISVVSQLGQGSQFTVLLPLKLR